MEQLLESLGRTCVIFGQQRFAACVISIIPSSREFRFVNHLLCFHTWKSGEVALIAAAKQVIELLYSLGILDGCKGGIRFGEKR